MPTWTALTARARRRGLRVYAGPVSIAVYAADTGRLVRLLPDRTNLAALETTIMSYRTGGRS